MAGDNAGTIFLGVQADPAGLSRSASGLGGIGKQLKGIATLAGAAFAVKGLISFGSSAIKLGSDLAEVQNVVDVTFGDGAGTIDNWAAAAATGFGLSETSAKKYTGTMGAMLKSMGLSGDSIVGMSTDIAGLAGDFASFYNLDADDAFAKIRSGISGETEPLKQLGINLSVANLEAYALKDGLGKVYASMSEQEKALTRYNYLMSVSADAQGDFTRTSKGWANQSRILSLQWDSFKATFGQGLINMFSPILIGINRVMGGLVKLGKMFSAFTGSLFGTSDAATSVGGALEGIAASGTDAAGGQDDAAAATKAAGKAASAMMGPFDKLNTMQSTAADDGGGGASTGGGGPAIGGGGMATPPAIAETDEIGRAHV